MKNRFIGERFPMKKLLHWGTVPNEEKKTKKDKLIFFSPFCSYSVIFVILIRIYRMGEYTRASAHVGAPPVIREKALFPFGVIPIPFNFCKTALLSLCKICFNLFNILFNCFKFGLFLSYGIIYLL